MAMATLMYMTTEHVPVLATELVALLDPQPGEVAIDCTFGGGGHARLVADRIGPTGTLICVDRDPSAAERYAELEPELGCRSRFVAGDFADVLERLGSEGERPDLAYMDLGISSLQLDTAERGFSYSYDAPLDMRMDTTQDLSARELVNEWPRERLETTIRELGEERHARSIADEIVRRRPLATTCELVEAIRAAVPPAYRFGRGHPAKRTFQAIRIAVNGELDSLDRALPAAWSSLRDGGRIAAISFHSLEDRRVKRFFSDLARGCVCPRSSRSVSAATSPRRSCSRAGRSSRPSGRPSAIPVRAPRACGSRRRCPAQEVPARRANTGRGRRWRPRRQRARRPRDARRPRASPRPVSRRPARARAPGSAPPHRAHPDRRFRSGGGRPHRRCGRRNRRFRPRRPADPVPSVDRPPRRAADRDRGAQRDGPQLQRLLERRRPPGRRAEAAELGAARGHRDPALEPGDPGGGGQARALQPGGRLDPLPATVPR